MHSTWKPAALRQKKARNRNEVNGKIEQNLEKTDQHCKCQYKYYYCYENK